MEASGFIPPPQRNCGSAEFGHQCEDPSCKNCTVADEIQPSKNGQYTNPRSYTVSEQFTNICLIE